MSDDRKDYRIQGLKGSWDGEPLSNTEREMVRVLLEPGMPLWKIMREWVDYQDGLKSSLVDADLTDPGALRGAAKVQATIQGINEFITKLETDLELEQVEEENEHGN